MYSIQNEEGMETLRTLRCQGVQRKGFRDMGTK